MSTPNPPQRVALLNGSFEEPSISGLEILPDASQVQEAVRVPGWLTTATDHKIELWQSGTLGVPSAHGSQFAELNANQVSTLYQDLPTAPGTRLYWKLYHRGRLGQDTMALDIGDPGAPVEQRLFTDGNTAWGLYSGTYTVPVGQTTTRFSFRSVAAAGGNPGIGNFLDGIFFGTAPVVVLTKSAVPAGPVDVGDVITYRVTVKNEGGGQAGSLRLTDTIPPGTTYLPNSLSVVDGPNTGPKSDQAGDDQGRFDATADQVVFNLGDGASGSEGGSLPNTIDLPDGTTVEYRVTVDRANADGQITNQATATYENRLGPEPETLTVNSNEVTTEIRPAADLALVKAADQTKVTVGQTVVYRITVANSGPDDATGVTVTDVLPGNLSFVSAASSTGAYDPLSGVWAVGGLANGASATLTLHTKAVAAGQTVNTATVTSNEKDPDPVNNTDRVTICVEAAPSCCAPCQTWT